MTATTTDLLLEATGISKSFGAVVALKNASLAVRPGEVHALMGANGAGKSTFVKILTGNIHPDSGQLAVRGRPREVHSPGEARRGGLVSVYQEPALIPDLDIRSNLRLTETPVEPFRHWLAELGLEGLDLMTLARRLPLATLRIIDLARGLATEPDVLMLDEMTAALPANLTERVLEVVGRTRGTDRSVIFISHRLIEIAAVCDRATVLREGETVGVVDVSAGSEERIVELMLGQVVKDMQTVVDRAADVRASDATPRIAARNLALGAKLQDVSFDLYPGEVLGVVALEGQGQDELFDILSGSARRQGRHPRDRRQAGHLPPPCRRDPRGPRLRARRPRRGAPDAAVGAGQHRAPVHHAPGRLGPDPRRSREEDGGRGDREAPDRHAGAGRGPPPVGRQPAEGHDRALGRRWRDDHALFRPHPRHRHPDQAADLRPAPGPRGGRRRRAAVHVGAQGDPACLRPGGRDLQRAPGGRDPRRRGR